MSNERMIAGRTRQTRYTWLDRVVKERRASHQEVCR